MVATAGLACEPAIAQQSIPITGDRLSGFILPIEPVAADITLTALDASAWAVDDTRRLVLEGDVVVSIGAQAFSAREAVVWINRLPSAAGLINQIAVYFPEVADPGRQAGLGVRGGPLLVTASARGEVRLNVALLENVKPPRAPLVRAAEERLADHLKRLLAQPPDLATRPQLESLAAPERRDFVPVPGGAARPEDVALPATVDLPPDRPRPWLSEPGGLVRFAAEKIDIESGEVENVITAAGSIMVEYLPGPGADPDSQLTMSAERAVIFTDPGPLEEMAGGALSAGNVRGVYLEGNVTVYGQDRDYMVRSPHVYYDFRRDQAIMLDALLRIQPRSLRRPVFARAQEMRQLAANQWEGRKIRASTSEFNTPHLAIGAERMLITQELPAADAAEGAEQRIVLDSHDNTLRVLGVPIAYWPRFQGTVQDVPLKRVALGTADNNGLEIMTTWDLLTLMGVENREGVDAGLRLDGFTKRGAAAGLELEYDVGDAEGAVDLYGLHDNGIDRTSSGRDVEPDHEFRGVAILEHQAKLSRYWSMQAQLSYISDETFISAWREDDFTERREYESSVYLKHQRDNAALTLLAAYNFQDFLSNSYLLASRQYGVNKVPELTWRRYGDSLFGDRVTYSMENRISRMSLAFQETTPTEIGVRPRAFGLGPFDEIDDALRAAGFTSQWVSRIDSRHELSMPLKAGAFNVTPFVVGRLTGYDDDFEDFSSDADNLRAFGAAGVRVNTQLQKIDNAAESRLFDLHRVRHLIEPYLTLWAAHASVEQEDLPTYDEEVESLADGTAVQLGVRNVWQTQRGGPGRWRSVDFLTLDTYVVLDSEGEPEESPTPQFFEYRPEYSLFGDHVHAAMTWLLSDSLALLGEATYILDSSEFARGSIGAELRHSPLLLTFAEYRFIEIDDTRLLNFGWTYQLTPKYRVTLNPQWDFKFDEFRAFGGRLVRSFPDFDFILQVRHDAIRDDTSLGASIDFVEF